MNRRIIVVVSFLVLALMSGGTVVSFASPSPDPKKNKKQAKTDPLLAQSLIRQAYVFMQQQTIRRGARTVQPRPKRPTPATPRSTT